MPRPDFSELAENDYIGIFDFGVERFGLEQAITYQFGMDELLDTLGDSPLSHQQVGESQRFRRAVYKSHAIYFEIAANDRVKILRIIGRQAYAKPFSR